MYALLRHCFRAVLVVVGIIVVTSISIDATDTFRNSQSALGIFATRLVTPTCPVGTVPLQQETGILCVDQYEAAVGVNCGIAEPHSITDTADNYNDADCRVTTIVGSLPWRFVTVNQARALCARSGKRLPTPAEWYAAALGTPDGENNCNLVGTLGRTGDKPDCRSGVGVYDMIGNVWEYTDGTVRDGYSVSGKLPAAGYVSGISSWDGFVSTTTTTPQVQYNRDYFWSEEQGDYSIMRGGFYGSGTDGGLYSMHSGTNQEFGSAAVGFRCVRSL